MKKSNYMTRALKSKDSRYAVILGKLGHVGADESQPRSVRKQKKSPEPTPVETSEPVDTLAELREEYREVIGKQPYHGWDEADLRRRIDEYKADDDE